MSLVSEREHIRTGFTGGSTLLFLLGLESILLLKTLFTRSGIFDTLRLLL